MPSYEPTEEMAEFMSGTDQTLTVIADPDTDQEKIHPMSCGKNGRIGIYFAEGYENFYVDKECTVLYESKESDGVIYVAKGK